MGREAKTTFTGDDKTKGAFSSLFGSFKKMDGLKAAAFGGFAKLGADAVTAIKNIPAAIASAVQETAISMDDLAKSANRIGVAVDEFDALSFAVQLNGASIETVESLFKRASRSINDASNGIGTAAPLFKKMGISARDSSGMVKSVGDIIMEVADALPQLESETEKTAASLELFGRAGQTILPMLKLGSEGIKSQLVQARSLGVRYREMTVEAEELIDAQLRWTTSMRNAKDAIAIEVIPALSKLANFLSEKLIDVLTKTDRSFRDFLAELRVGPVEEELAGLQQRLIDLNEAVAAGEAARLESIRNNKFQRNASIQLADATEAARIVMEAHGFTLKDLNNIESEREKILKATELAQERKTEKDEAAESKVKALAAATRELKAEMEADIFTDFDRDREVSFKIQGPKTEDDSRFRKKIKVDVEEIDETERAFVDMFSSFDRSAAKSALVFTNQMGTAFRRWAFDGVSAADAVKDAFKDALAQIAQAAVVELFTGGLGSLFPSIKGLLDGDNITIGGADAPLAFSKSGPGSGTNNEGPSISSIQERELASPRTVNFNFNSIQPAGEAQLVDFRHAVNQVGFDEVDLPTV